MIWKIFKTDIHVSKVVGKNYFKSRLLKTYESYLEIVEKFENYNPIQNLTQPLKYYRRRTDYCHLVLTSNRSHTLKHDSASGSSSKTMGIEGYYKLSLTTDVYTTICIAYSLWLSYVFWYYYFYIIIKSHFLETIWIFILHLNLGTIFKQFSLFRSNTSKPVYNCKSDYRRC